MLRPRNSLLVRADALKMAIRKAKTGCYPCAQGYFELAKKHGATEEEISHAIAADEVSEQSISRRRLLQLTAVLVAGATLAVRDFLPQRAEASSFFWGTDSNSETMLDIPQNFYIGRFGYGTTGSAYFFNIGAAQIAGRSGTFMYWGLEGPGLAPPGMSLYSWGREQASAALNQRYDNPNAGFVGGYTVFADIETGFGGWTVGSSAYSSNQQVVQGFLDGIAAARTSTAPFHPGIYISPLNWRSYVGTDFRPATSFVLWITGCYSCNSSICAPCDNSCWSTLATVTDLLPTVTSTILGGSQAFLWQYWLDPPCGCGDFNVAIQDPASGFIPISSSTTYSSIC
jgi:AhpD family alkylhydroperoxidase